jgi:hypothetical protein
VTIFFLFSFEDGGVERAARWPLASFASFLLVIRVHSSVREVDSGVLRVDEPSAPGLLKVIFSRSAGGCAFLCLAPIFSEIFEDDFFSSGSATRCRVPSSSATDEIVPKQNTDPGRRMILCWKVGSTTHPYLVRQLSVFWVRPRTRGCPSRCFLV